MRLFRTIRIGSGVGLLALSLVVVVPRTACAQGLAAEGEKADSLSEAQKIYGLSLFWKEAKDYFVYFDQVPDLDWDAAYREYIPRVLATTSTLDYYLELKRFAALLEDGHTSVSFPDALRRAFDNAAGIGVRAIGRRAWVLNVSEELVRQAPLGSEIIAVDGIPAERYLREQVFPLIPSSTDEIRWKWGIEGVSTAGYGLLVRRTGTPITITVRTPDGTVREVHTICEYPTQGIKWVKGPSVSYSFSLEYPANGIAYLQIATFDSTSPVEQFEKAVPELYGAKGIIIDLRRNGGGSTSNAEAILRHFTEVPLQGVRWKAKELRGAYKAWGELMPDRKDYAPYATGAAWYEGGVDVLRPGPGRKLTMPVIVLIGPETASAAEDFLVYARRIPTFTFMGEPTFGSTGQPIRFALPGGGSGRVCAKRDQFGDGTDWVGTGILPDIRAARTVDSYIQGESNVGIDNVLAEAVQEMKRRIAALRH